MELRLFLGEFFDAICVTDCGKKDMVWRETSRVAPSWRFPASVIQARAPLPAQIAAQACAQQQASCSLQARVILGPNPQQSLPAVVQLGSTITGPKLKPTISASSIPNVSSGPTPSHTNLGRDPRP
ncbi:hypothetical protein TIFTF001_045317 [Ficus carica]|uniref:Uncharacterized protein n=1 Tax=Ficus carica TaxID=3494 RepID=A0AA87YQM0_FICCA|nr:hypothetical protein TIFTF001_045317 [Ficus carica]